MGLCPVDQHLFLLDAETSECGVCVCETGEQGVVILGEDGSPSNSLSQASDNLQIFWTDVFKEKEVNLGTAYAALHNYVQVCPSDISWDVGLDSFRSLIASRVDTGNGPDGLVYSF